MVNKEELQFSLRRMQRRVQFRAEERVKTSLFFYLLSAVLHELNNKNEEEIEEELDQKGSMSFRGFYSPYKVTLKVEFEEIETNEENECSTKGT